jgi:hypothetical protein
MQHSPSLLHRPRLVLATASALLALAAEPTAAQSLPSTSLRVVAGGGSGELPGPQSDDVSGFVAGLRLEQRLARFLVIEPGASRFSGGGARAVLMEVALQLEAPLPRVRPYVGAGLGYAFLSAAEDALAGHVAGGARVQLSEAWSLGVEARGRFLRDGWYLVEGTAGMGFRIR